MRYQPMLAHAAKDEEAILHDHDFVAERKEDGHRILVEWPARGGKPQLFSRLGKDRTNDAPFLSQIVWPQDVILDGELVVPGGTSSDVTDLSNRGKLVYVAFDVLAADGFECIGDSYIIRRDRLERIVHFKPAVAGPQQRNAPASRDGSRVIHAEKIMGVDQRGPQRARQPVDPPGRRGAVPRQRPAT